MDYSMSRQIIYCSITKQKVLHELSYVYKDGVFDSVATCTGVSEACTDCPLLEFNRAYEAAPTPLKQLVSG
ncbi:hypothetical protein SAMN05421781_1460 [Marinococcus luteus]|uniref:Uncharacterized protein n=1 Tax=Marinococcus luteus TaxID=1122204 RepID=A0A1H2TKS8_9BACI|nr:hypothetical protein [Marinococcus luteus]SDW44616.1 hypothetical protein SAMN05421781_1460 [Marinococcus luteus]